jgi:hypothetical protein
MQDEASDMPGFVRSSAFALAAALGVAAACAAWHSGEPPRSARLPMPRVPAASFVPAAPGGDSQAQRALLGSPQPGDPRCERVGCADGLIAEVAEFCSVCLDPTGPALSGFDRSDFDGLGTPLAISLAAFAPEFRGDPHPLYLASIGPAATAAPTPEISTGAMLTMGFAGVVWTVRRARRPPSMSRPKPCPC